MSTSETQKKTRCFECFQATDDLELFQGRYSEPEMMCKDCIRIIKHNMAQEEFCQDYGIHYWEAPWT